MTAILFGGFCARTPRVEARTSVGTTNTLLFTVKLLTFEIIIFYPKRFARSAKKFDQSRSETWNASRKTESAGPQRPRRSCRWHCWGNTSGLRRWGVAGSRERGWDCKPNRGGRER